MKMSKSKRRAAAQVAAAPKSPTPAEEHSVEFTEEQRKLIFVAVNETKIDLLTRIIDLLTRARDAWVVV